MKRLLIYLLLPLSVLPATAQETTTNQEEATPDTLQQTEEHVWFLGQPLSTTPQQMLHAMRERGLRYEQLDSTRHTYCLRGTLSGMDIAVDMRCNKELTKINHIRLSTAKGLNQQDDYERMLHWLLREYEQPDWRGSVRSHHFCRWFADFDRDIVLIATGSGTVEAWLFENHQQRNIDYYSILKYCERTPAPNVPALTARECVTWKSDSVPNIRKHVAKRGRKRTAVRKRKAVRRRPAARRKPARRRR